MASSSDEGEITENGVEDLKASSLPRAAERSSVDRQDRPRSRQSSPDRDSLSKHSGSSRRSRSPRGYKRPRDHRDYYGRKRDGDSRYSRDTYDDRRRDSYDRPRKSYEDLDNPASNASHSSRGAYGDYDERDYYRRERDRYRDSPDRDRYSDKRARRHSRSPRRPRASDKGRLDRFVRESDTTPHDYSRGLRYDDDRESHRSGSTYSKTPFARGSGVAKDDAKPEKVFEPGSQPSKHPSDKYVRFLLSHEHGNLIVAREPTRQQQKPDPEPEPEIELEPIDEEAEIQRRRKRREEILAKSSSATPLLLHAVGASEKIRAASPALSDSVTPQSIRMELDGPQTPRTPQSSKLSLSSSNNRDANSADDASPRSPGSREEPSPGRMDLVNEIDLRNLHSNAKVDNEDGPSAADYDPTADMKEDERRDELRHGQVVLHGESHVLQSTEQQSEDPSPRGKENPSAEADDDFDMFADDFDEDKYATKAAPAAANAIETIEGDANAQANGKGGMLEGDDKDGYYKIRIGEVLEGRYQIQTTLGRGMFSGVVRAVDITNNRQVAIKIMRNNDALRKGGYTEIAILQKLNDADPENRKHIIKFERSFDYRGHLCMVFESLSLNLREVLRKFGNNVGINLSATRAYAYQTFVALAHMRKCSIIHADLKPDNILVNESRNVLKICDLGTAIDRSDAATSQAGFTPYLVSRFYRAPEIILGIPYDYSVDMWSIGCTLYELYTGKILFTGDSNNQMLKAIMEIRGRITPKLYKRGPLSSVHFDDLGQFLSVERDKVLNKTTVRTLTVVKPTRDLRTRIMAASGSLNEVEARELNHFIDLLEHCLALNPDKRIKPIDALKHPFFTMWANQSSKK